MAAKQMVEENIGQDLLSEGEKKYFDNFKELDALRKSVYGKMNWWPQNVFLPDKGENIEWKRQLLQRCRKPEKENLDERLRSLYRQQGNTSRISQQQQSEKKEILQQQKQPTVECSQQQQKSQQNNPDERHKGKQKNKQQEQNKFPQVQHVQQGKPLANLSNEERNRIMDELKTFNISSAISTHQDNGMDINSGRKTGYKENFNGYENITDSSSSNDHGSSQLAEMTSRACNGKNGQPTAFIKQKTLTDISSSSRDESAINSSSKKAIKKDTKVNAKKGRATRPSFNKLKRLTDTSSSSGNKSSSKKAKKTDYNVNA